MSVKAPRARRIAQTKTKSFKASILPVGTVLLIGSYEQVDTGKDNKDMADFLLCTDTASGKTIKLPVREFNALIVKDKSDIVRAVEGSSDEIYPNSITIESSDNRLDREDKPFYPAFAYKESEAFYNSLGTDTQMAWADCRPAGADLAGYRPVHGRA